MGQARSLRGALGPAIIFLLALLLPIHLIPTPVVHDEFAYLLGAETFRDGRLTNPPHPMWIHFETFHEIFQPTYQSKYPPAQSLILALGWKLFGHPWYGVLLSSALMCAALCWMLQGWLPSKYALLGGLMAFAQFEIASYWIDSYWGGAVAAAAGALVIGAVPRLVRHPTRGVAILASFGILMLANSRPYEGCVTAAAAAVVLLVWRRKKPFPWPAMVPAIAILALGAFWMFYYNYRLTGNPLLMPYALYQRQYGAAPIFWFLPSGPPPAYHHEVIRRLWQDWDRSYYLRAHAFPPVVLLPFLATLQFFLNPISAVALFAAFLRWTRKVRFALVIAAAVSIAILLERFSLPHYLAPVTGAILLLVMLGVQFIRVKFGRWAFATFIVLFFGVAVFQAARLPVDPDHQLFAAHRQAVVHQLASFGSQHLVIVRYTANHDVHEEWVFNHADIDSSQIVWARDMGDAANRELLVYYPRRQAWLLDADAPSPLPVPYPR